MTLPVNNDSYFSLFPKCMLILFSCLLALAIMRILLFFLVRCLLQISDKSSIQLEKIASTPGSLRMFTMS